MAEIKNTSGGVIAVLVGNPESPSEVKILQHGETFVSTAPNLTVVDDSYPGLKNRRASSQSASGRRVADPRVDARLPVPVKKAEKVDAEAQAEAEAEAAEAAAFSRNRR